MLIFPGFGHGMVRFQIKLSMKWGLAKWRRAVLLKALLVILTERIANIRQSGD